MRTVLVLPLLLPKLFSGNAEAEDLLPQPGLILAVDGTFDIGFGECGKTYRLERSLDKKHWIPIDTHPLWYYGPGPGPRPSEAGPACERDFIDKTPIPRSTQRLYYRYFELDQSGKTVGKSAIGEVDMSEQGQWARDYWPEKEGTDYWMKAIAPKSDR